ncbi:hypothetical protein CKQ80_10005 [Pseudomonas moraviensis]|uniref:Uncharacterized protein n=1 Tax=Pseudomonas moraviensis TaxID=321662 RepID=A0A2A2PJJ8_9PSED|nr:hypothetical protein [Pseudomonas moraviensis]PAW51114.1 hypothetical protein CKQ68_27840 [Pseudomonas moraviensis]PAW55624.1 hypothetical protein CKQ80_10005 [Pseudomonas moraviensis]
MLDSLAQNSTVAYYCHMTQTIHLKRVEEANVKAFMAALTSESPKENLGTVTGCQTMLRPLIHELRHWADMNCSVRGLKTLKRIFGLGMALQPNNPLIPQLKKDLGLAHFIERHDHTNGIAYYPWRFSLSISVPMYHEMLEHISLCFFSGLDVKKEKILFKSPIYLGSMLETCATFQEMRDAVPLMVGHASWAEMQAMFIHDELEFTKDPTQPEYHSIAHAYAAAGCEQDLVSAFSLASSVCTLLLHMPAGMLLESCKRAVYWAEKYDPQSNMKDIMEICPEAGLIYHFLRLIHTARQGKPLKFDEDLVFELFPYWKTQRSSFFEQSHEQFKKNVIQASAIGPNYFRDSIPALIANNQYILEQESLVPTLIRLPKRPPIICGDGHILTGAPEFDQVLPFYEDFPVSDAEALLNPEKLPVGIVRRVVPRWQ